MVVGQHRSLVGCLAIKCGSWSSRQSCGNIQQDSIFTKTHFVPVANHVLKTEVAPNGTSSKRVFRGFEISRRKSTCRLFWAQRAFRHVGNRR